MVFCKEDTVTFKIFKIRQNKIPAPVDAGFNFVAPVDAYILIDRVCWEMWCWKPHLTIYDVSSLVFFHKKYPTDKDWCPCPSGVIIWLKPVLCKNSFFYVSGRGREGSLKFRRMIFWFVLDVLASSRMAFPPDRRVNPSGEVVPVNDFLLIRYSCCVETASASV